MGNATHQAPSSGLATYSSPHPDALLEARLDPGLPVELTEKRGDWTQVRCANDWTCWVDGRLLEELPPPFSATHRVPASGLSTYTSASPETKIEPRLDPGLSVMVVEQRGDWARVRCENDWTCWIDARNLTPVT